MSFQTSSLARVASFFGEHPKAFRALLKTLGHDEAFRLARLTRDEIIAELRVKHRWTLQAIGDLFDLSRERVRQLTPPIDGTGKTPVISNPAGPSDPKVMKEELKRVFRRAVRDPRAWNARGQLSKAWVIDQLGYEPTLPELDFRNPGGPKTKFILRYGLDLQTRQEMRDWAEEMYFERCMTYDEIARWLSQRFVPVAAMTVHRVIAQDLDVGGYGTGRRADRAASGN